jgi:hypothetical protein
VSPSNVFDRWDDVSKRQAGVTPLVSGDLIYQPSKYQFVRIGTKALAGRQSSHGTPDPVEIDASCFLTITALYRYSYLRSHTNFIKYSNTYNLLKLNEYAGTGFKLDDYQYLTQKKQ